MTTTPRDKHQPIPAGEVRHITWTALTEYAAQLRREARTRKWRGEAHKDHRAQLRQIATDANTLAQAVSGTDPFALSALLARVSTL